MVIIEQSVDTIVSYRVFFILKPFFSLIYRIGQMSHISCNMSVSSWRKKVIDTSMECS